MHNRLALLAPLLLAAPTLALATGCASAAPEAAPEGPTATASEPIQLIDFLAGQAALAQDGSTASHATAALYIPFLNADHTNKVVFAGGSRSYQVRGTCGVTFISPHYAITASHCVANDNVFDPANQTFTIRSFDITAMNPSSLWLDTYLKGTFPSYTGTPASTVPGYTATDLTCRIVSRCAFSNQTEVVSDYNCGSTADVTMLYCPDRGPSAPWLGVAEPDPGTGPVEMYWFHEIVNAPLTAAGANSQMPLDLVSHYTNDTPGNEPNNWHYIGAPTNVLIPLKAVDWPSGGQRRRLGVGSTDLFGCHGTSGSGVLQRNASGNLELLGPVHSGGVWSNTKLCDDPTTAVPGNLGITYTPNSQVQILTTKFSRILFTDRLAIRVAPPLPVSGAAAAP